GNRQLAVGERASNKQARHQQRGCDGPEDEGSRDVHAPGLRAPVSAFGARTSTLLPSWSLSMPSTTTSSFGARPRAIEALSPSVMPTATGRTSAVWLGFTT